MADIMFIIANGIVTPAWLAMIFLPRWTVTHWLARSNAAPIAVACCYVAMVVAHIGAGGEGHFFSLDGVSQLFETRSTVATAWIHFLAFDLFVGHWEFRDARARGLAHRWVVVPLFFTLMLGPIGLLLYLVVRRLGGLGVSRETRPTTGE